MNCQECKERRQEPESVPYAVHEISLGIMERTIKRLWIALLIVICLLVASNCAWLWYESQFEDVTTMITQENADGYNNYIGNDGDIINGKADGNC